MQRVLLLSSVHPATDPRIFYKIVPSLASRYEVICALPNAVPYTETTEQVTMIRLPQYESLLARILLCHPVVLWKCLRLRPDLVHIFVPELIPLAILFKWLGAKIIYEVQENLFKKFEIKKQNNQLLFRHLFGCFDEYARKNFFLIFTEMTYLSEYNKLAHPSAVIQNFVSMPFVHKYADHNDGSKQNYPSFFYSGVISMERCFDTLVAALVILTHKYPSLIIHMFGPVRFSEKEANMLPDYTEVKKHFVFYGYTDLRFSLRNASDCLAGIALLKPVGDYPDSYPTKVFEYMALNLPVITSNFILYRSVVEKSHSGFCINPSDSALLATTLDRIIANPDQASIMGKNGRKAAEKHYNWAIEEKKLLNFYHTIL
jgi:glycosyltransferase involved in cell wall biosynthesis